MSRSITYAQSHSSLVEAWGDWIGTLAEWEWYVTLTVRDIPQALQLTGFNLPGMRTAKKMWRTFLERLSECSGVAKSEIDAVSVVEFQEFRRASHIHSLVGKVDYDLRELRAWSWEQFGWNKIYTYDKERGAKYYLCKYIVKDLQHIEFSESIVEREKEKVKNGENED